MSDLQVIRNDIIISTPEFCPDKIMRNLNTDATPELQRDADVLFLERARQAAGFLGERAILSYNLTDRLDEDQTLLGNNFFRAKPEKTESVTKTFLDQISNLDQMATEIDECIKKYNLTDYEELTIIMPHAIMADILAMTVLVDLSVLGKDRTVRDNYLFLSRLIPYIVFDPPFYKGEPINFFQEVVLPLGNGGLVFPETKSTQPLREQHHDEMIKHDGATLGAIKNDQRSRKNERGQTINYIAPSGAKIKNLPNEHTGGITKILKMEPIPKRTMDLLFNHHYTKGKPILTIGMNFNAPRMYVPGLPKQKIKMHIEPPIMPKKVERKDMVARFEFERTVTNQLQRSAQEVTNKAVTFG